MIIARITVGFLIVLAAASSLADAETLRARLSSTSIDRVVNRFSDLPAFEQRKLMKIRNASPVAEFGESYQRGDVVNDLPPARHVFSAWSEKLLAIIYQQSSIAGAEAKLLLTIPGESESCIYSLRMDISGAAEDLRYMDIQAIRCFNL